MEPDTTDLSGLKHSDWNPRKISQEDFESLIRSMKEFGDLSGIVKNLETGTLVGGNQRMEVFKLMQNPKIVYTHRHSDGPDAVGTTAEGFIETDNGGRFAYREVMWPLEKEKAANVAANRISGEWDIDLLAKVNYEIAQLDNGAELLELTGQKEKELKRLNKLIGVDGEEEPATDEPDDNKPEHMEFALTRGQREVVDEAIGNIKATKELMDIDNSSLNGNALFYLCKTYLDDLHGLNADPPITQATDEPKPSEERLDETPTTK